MLGSKTKLNSYLYRRREVSADDMDETSADHNVQKLVLTELLIELWDETDSNGSFVVPITVDFKDRNPKAYKAWIVSLNSRFLRFDFRLIDLTMIHMGRRCRSRRSFDSV
jgi:hypothetical protein